MPQLRRLLPPPLRARARQALRRVASTLDPQLHPDRVLARYVRRWVQPEGVEGPPTHDYWPEERLPTPGLEFDWERQCALIEGFGTRHGELFAALRNDPRINTRNLGEDRLHNGFYPTPDAEIYAAMIVERAPTQVVEIGSGFSSRIARHAIERLPGACPLLSIDPEPRTEITEVVDTLHRARLEDLDLDALDLGPGTLLFIDSSHIARAGGDVVVLFNQVIPSLPPGVLVHVHDICLPYDYPAEYQRRLYTEQYLLQALLAHSPRYRIQLSTHGLCRNAPARVQREFGPAAASDPLHFGGALWFEVVDPA